MYLDIIKKINAAKEKKEELDHELYRLATETVSVQKKRGQKKRGIYAREVNRLANESLSVWKKRTQLEQDIAALEEHIVSSLREEYK